MTKDQYLEMMDQMGQEPDWEKCPPDIEDFPPLVIDAINIFHTLGDRIYGDVGYTGKDFTNLPLLYKHYRIEEWQEEWVFEILIFLETRTIKESQKQLKASYDKIKK